MNPETPDDMLGATPGLGRTSSRIGLNAGAMLASRFICLLLSLVQTGIILRSLGVDGSGRFGFALGYAGLFAGLATLGIGRLLMRDIARDPTDAWRCVWTGEALLAVLSSLTYGLIAASAFLLVESPDARNAVLLAAVSVVVLYALQSPFEALLIAKERMALLSALYVLNGALKLLSLYWILDRLPTSAAAHAALAVPNAVTFVLCVVLALRVAGWEAPRFSMSEARALLRESLVVTLAMVFSMAYMKADLLLLTFLRGDTAAGLYVAPQRLTEPITMMASIWGVAVFPALCRFSASSPESFSKLRRTSARLALLAAFPIAFGAAALAEPLIGLLSGAPEEFAASVTVLRILCVSIPFFYFNAIAQEFLYAAHRNWAIALTYGLAALASLALNLAVIPRWGVNGAAACTIAVNVLISTIFFRGIRREVGPMGLTMLIIKSVAACTIMGLAAYGLSGISLALAVAVGAVVYGGLQIVLGTLDSVERALLAGMLRAVLSRLMRGRA